MTHCTHIGGCVIKEHRGLTLAVLQVEWILNFLLTKVQLDLSFENDLLNFYLVSWEALDGSSFLAKGDGSVWNSGRSESF